MTTEGTIDVGDTGDKLDTTVVTQTDGTEAHREAVVLADPENNDARANVVESISVARKYNACVVEEKSGSIVGALEMIIDQNEKILMMLESIAE